MCNYLLMNLINLLFVLNMYFYFLYTIMNNLEHDRSPFHGIYLVSIFTLLSQLPLMEYISWIFTITFY